MDDGVDVNDVDGVNDVNDVDDGVDGVDVNDENYWQTRKSELNPDSPIKQQF